MSMAQFKQHLEKLRAAVVPESNEDHAAFEYMGEIESVIEVIDAGGDVKEACDWVSIPYLVTV